MTFWQNKRVLITGHTGFKGSWLSLWLQFWGAELVGFSLPPPTGPNLFTLASAEKKMTSIFGDIRNFGLLQAIIRKYQPEIVFHLAAQPLVRTSYHDPITTYSTNVMGTAHLFEALRETETIKAIINITTDKCYENRESQWEYSETDRLGGHDPYSNSKACSELITAAYRDSYFKNRKIGLSSARAGNVIGGGDWAADRLIPDIIRACLIEKRPPVIRHPNAVRPWQHVLDPLNGYLHLAEALYHSPDTYANSWNFGPQEDEAKSVKWITNHLVKQLTNNSDWIQDNVPQLHEALYLRLDCTKAKTQLNWKAQWNLEKALAKTADWYQAYYKGADMQEITLSQIKNFIETARPTSP